MIALDTNVLVRLLVEDDAAQTAEAVRLVRRARDGGARLFVADIVLCELVWVLRSCYGRSRDDVARAVDALASAAQAEFESHDRMTAALDAFRRGKGDLADYLVRERAVCAGCDAVATFDAALHGDPAFVRPDPEAWPAGTSIREDAPPYGRRRRRAGGG